MAVAGRVVDGLLVGADLGATKVAAHAVSRRPEARYAAGPAAAAVEHDRVPGFRPLPLDEQLCQAAAGELDLVPGEREQAHVWIEDTARCVAAVARQAGRGAVLLGVAAPGRKSADGRGLVAVRNGPRVPDLAELLERRLRRLGIELLAPVEPLQSDGVCGCLGEGLAERGGLAGARHGYFVAGGTGVAEAAWLGGEARALDDARIGLVPAHSLATARGPVFEDRLSMRAVVSAERPGDVARDLAELIFRRLEAFGTGACGDRVWLERVLVGQRLGAWLATPGAGTEARGELARELGRRIAGGDPPEAAARYLVDGALGPDLVVLSELREAPAIGAAVLAERAFAGH